VASIGLYGVTSYLISQRTREFGIRMAVGATRGSVSLLLAAVALLASYIPARRAANADPMDSLRYE
jgi:ABC-type antimicrobial peptide transport system permease subunit